ncbi:MAG: helix-turn-helix transcriptional regulator [Candidatus Aminicenantes bacterium]|nr:helix-turn-helix transcriptional regulator [Candidatus Aminicenantes bacterium]
MDKFSQLKPPDVGKRITQLRKRLSMSQKEFASATQATQATISRAEKGAVTDAVLLYRMASLGGVSVDWLLTGYESRGEERGYAALAEESVHYGLSPEIAEVIEQLKRNPILANTIVRLLRSGKTGTKLLQGIDRLTEEQQRLILKLVTELAKQKGALCD